MNQDLVIWNSHSWGFQSFPNLSHPPRRVQKQEETKPIQSTKPSSTALLSGPMIGRNSWLAWTGTGRGRGEYSSTDARYKYSAILGVYLVRMYCQRDSHRVRS